MDKRFWAVIGVIAVVFVGIIVINNRKVSAPDGGSNNSTVTDHVKGGNAKNVKLVEYGDFQCPVCSIYEPVVEQVFAKYKDDIQFQFRNFPLQQVHQNAFAASRAAEAAGLQNKYWEMHDKLYANQSDWSASSDPLSVFSGYAQTIGINQAKFKTDFSSKQVNDAINADIKAGEKLNVSGTPTFYLNGKELPLKELVGSDGRPTVDKFSKALDDAINKQTGQAQ